MSNRLIPNNAEQEAIDVANVYETNDTLKLTFEEEEFVPRSSWLRWPLLFLFTNCIMIVSALSLCLSPVSSNLAEAYQISQVEVNMCAIIFTATFVPMTFASMWMFRVMKNHNVLRLACLLCLIGGWIRHLATFYGFWPVLLG